MKDTLMGIAELFVNERSISMTIRVSWCVTNTLDQRKDDAITITRNLWYNKKGYGGLKVLA